MSNYHNQMELAIHYMGENKEGKISLEVKEEGKNDILIKEYVFNRLKETIGKSLEERIKIYQNLAKERIDQRIIVPKRIIGAVLKEMFGFEKNDKNIAISRLVDHLVPGGLENINWKNYTNEEDFYKFVCMKYKENDTKCINEAAKITNKMIRKKYCDIEEIRRWLPIIPMILTLVGGYRSIYYPEEKECWSKIGFYVLLAAFILYIIGNFATSYANHNHKKLKNNFVVNSVTLGESNVYYGLYVYRPYWGYLCILMYVIRIIDNAGKTYILNFHKNIGFGGTINVSDENFTITSSDKLENNKIKEHYKRHWNLYYDELLEYSNCNIESTNMKELFKLWHNYCKNNINDLNDQQKIKFQDIINNQKIKRLLDL
jgi:hypothetical protein